jgi:ribosome-associated translation inhibitor RaiA
LIEIKAGAPKRSLWLTVTKGEAVMPMTTQIAFHGLDPSPAMEAQARRRAAGLAQLSDRIVACKVALEAAHRSQRPGAVYRVRIELMVPGGEIVVSQEPTTDHAHEDMRIAIRDAFDAARRQLRDRMRRLESAR